MLANIEALSHIKTICEIDIRGNASLASCAVLPICKSISVLNALGIAIENNAAGCNSIAEVTNACNTDFDSASLQPFTNFDIVCPLNQTFSIFGQDTIVKWAEPIVTKVCNYIVDSILVKSNLKSGSTFAIENGALTSKDVIYTAVASDGKQAACTFTIAINPITSDTSCSSDNIPPTITFCPESIALTIVGTDTTVTWTEPTATDNCSTPSVSSDFTSGQRFSIGVTNVIYVFVDDKNNSSRCSFAITIDTMIAPMICDNDSIAPIITDCPQNIVLTITGTDTTATWAEPMSTDNCSTPSLSSNFLPGQSFSIGITTVTYTSVDAKNNSSICRFDIKVDTMIATNTCDNDTIAPMITGCPQNIVLTITGTDTTATWIEPMATDNCSPPSVSSNFTSGQSFPIGLTTVTYIAMDDKNNRSTCSFNIKVDTTLASNGCINDTIPPVITNCPQDIALTIVGTDTTVMWVLPTVTDNCNEDNIFPMLMPDHTPGDRFSEGRTTVNYLAMDKQNNTVTCHFVVAITRTSSPNVCNSDVIPPVITNCPQSRTIMVAQTDTIVTWTEPTVTDNCSTRSVSSNYTSGQTFLLGATNVTYTATDGNNNKSTCNFTITIKQQATLPNDNYCFSRTDQPWQEWVSRVQFNTLDNESDKMVSSIIGYSPFLGISTGVQRGETYPLSIIAGTSWYGRNAALHCRAWIDFDGNGRFDDSEIVLEQNGRTSYFTNVTIPTTATRGRTRMRVSILSGEYATACQDSGLGEIEDYAIIIDPTTDISLSISSLSTTYKEWMQTHFIITARNEGNADVQNIKISFPFPNLTVTGGTATSTVGRWREFCPGNIHCYQWSIPSIAAGGSATLDVPVYILNSEGDLTATVSLLSSTPTDTIVPNNTASVTIHYQSVPQAQAHSNPTQLIPVIIEKISPNPTDGELAVRVESLDERDVIFNISDAVGKTLREEKRHIEKGTNQVPFDVLDLPQGMYFIQVSSNRRKHEPAKFVKM